MKSLAVQAFRRRQTLQGGLGAMAALAFGGAARAQTKFSWGIGSIDPFFSCCYVTLKKGYFKDQGIDVEYINSQSGPRTKQMLAAGQILVGTSGAGDPLTVTIAGKPATLIFGLDRKITYANMLVHKDNYDSGKYRAVKDLGGTRIAVTQPQSATWLMAIFMTERAGVKNVDIRGLGDLATMLGALKSKQVAASVATMGMMEQAVQEGWGVPIFDVTDDKAWTETFGGDVPGLGAYVMEDSIAKRPQELQAFVTAMTKGQDFINGNAPAAIVDLVQEDYLSSFPKESLVKTIGVYKDKVWKKDNIIGKAEYDRLIGIMGGGRQYSDEELKKVPYERAVNMSFVKKARNL
jgi:NitT/TauT family transport system substrate-binding protein